MSQNFSLDVFYQGVRRYSNGFELGGALLVTTTKSPQGHTGNLRVFKAVASAPSLLFQQQQTKSQIVCCASYHLKTILGGFD